jgi:hypothetical protein
MSKMAFIEKPEVDLLTMQDLRQHAGLEEYDTSDDEKILKMSGFAFLNACLEWNGIIGYTSEIIDAIQMAYGIDLTEYPFDEPIERSLEEV